MDEQNEDRDEDEENKEEEQEEPEDNWGFSHSSPISVEPDRSIYEWVVGIKMNFPTT